MENCSRRLLMSSFHGVQSLFSSGDITLLYLLLILPNFLQEFQNKDTQHNVHSFHAFGKVCNADYFIDDEGMSLGDFIPCNVIQLFKNGPKVRRHARMGLHVRISFCKGEIKQTVAIVLIEVHHH